LLRLHPERIHVVALAPQTVFSAPSEGDPASEARAAREAGRVRARLGLPERYLVYAGRFDARHDLPTLLHALAALGTQDRPDGLAEAVPWPPRVLVLGASPDDRAAIARAAARLDTGDLLVYAPQVAPAIAAALVRGARAALIPLLSDAAGSAAIDAIAVGTPVVAASVGALTDLVGAAGILVEPRDIERLTVAIRAVWTEDRVHDRIAAGARDRAAADRRSWADVARETRAVYAAAGVRTD
jgi:glycosyltransferase involved in cell wall biosynthesis